MEDKRNLVKRRFWLKQASICLHNIPKDAKIQNLGYVFSTFLYIFFKFFIKNHDFGFLKIQWI